MKTEDSFFIVDFQSSDNMIFPVETLQSTCDDGVFSNHLIFNSHNVGAIQKRV